MEFTVQHRQVLKGVPSASGIVAVDDRLYVIGDNSAWLYQLNDQYDVANAYVLLPGVMDSILSKDAKPDFEAMTAIPTEGHTGLLVFGSGSKSPERDTIASITLSDSIQTTLYEATTFYDALRSSTYLDAESMNIEAAATIDTTLYLFNREHNLLLEYDLNAVLGFLKGLNELPSYKAYRINLPELNGLPAKFSGASAVPGSQQLVFTASVENAPNTYDDGEVLGSYVGIIDLAYVKDGYQPECTLITEDSKTLAIKVESVEVIKVNSPNVLTVVLVTDSDGGASELLVGELTW